MCVTVCYFSSYLKWGKRKQYTHKEKRRYSWQLYTPILHLHLQGGGRRSGKMLCNVATCQENYHLSPVLVLVVQNVNRTEK